MQTLEKVIHATLATIMSCLTLVLFAIPFGFFTFAVIHATAALGIAFCSVMAAAAVYLGVFAAGHVFRAIVDY